MKKTRLSNISLFFILSYLLETLSMKSITAIINEEMRNFMNENSGELLGIPEVAEILSRVDPNLTLNDLQGMLHQEYQNGGDDAVRKFFFEMTKGTDLRILGRGKYALKFN